MDGIFWLLISWFIVAVFCYFFILTYNNRRKTSIVVPTTVESGEDEQYVGTSFMNDLLNWLVWGLDENASNEQRLGVCLEKFVSKALNEASHRLRKESQPEVHFDSIQVPKKSAIFTAFQNAQIHANRTPGNHLSFRTRICSLHARNGPICMRISVADPFRPGGDQQPQTQHHPYQQQQQQPQRRKIPTLEYPSCRLYDVLVKEMIGDIETRLASINSELFVISCFDDRPDIQMEFAELTGGGRRAEAIDLEEFVRRCIIGAVLNFSLGELLYPDTETSARASRARLSAEYRNLSFLQEIYPPSSAAQYDTPATSPRFPAGSQLQQRPTMAELYFANILRIQLLEAYDLQGLNVNERPFVCIELDEPSSERFLSPKAHLFMCNDQQQVHPKGVRVYWPLNEANFELRISPSSGELLFEVFTEPAKQMDNDAAMPMHDGTTERRFLGMAILGLNELRQTIMAGQTWQEPIRLQLQWRPEMARERAKEQQQQRLGIAGTGYGVLLMKCSFHHRQQVVDRPSAPLPDNQSPILAGEFAQNRRKRTASPTNIDQQSPTEFDRSKQGSFASHSIGRSSTGSKKRGGLQRQKEHYIYNVTDEREQQQRQQQQQEHLLGQNGAAEKQMSLSPAPKSATISIDAGKLFLIPSTASHEHAPVEPMHGSTTQNIKEIRKTTSDTNALFQFQTEKVERKRSAPETPPVLDNNAFSRGSRPRDSRRKFIRKIDMEREGAGAGEDEEEGGGGNAVEQRQTTVLEQQQEGEPREGSDEGRHPAMEIFRVPATLQPPKTEETGMEIERRARERDRRADGGHKQRKNFFEQIRTRLTGSVRLLPGKHSKRAKSLDDYEQPHLEEAAFSVPQSRDQSQTRYGISGAASGGHGRKGSDGQLEQINQMHQQHHFISQTIEPRSPLYSQSPIGKNTQLILLEMAGIDDEGPTYYSIPAEVATEPAVVNLMQRGKKLHVHLEHMLVASKSRGRVICSICNKRIGGNFSNCQAYQCRDCRIVCHKSCHRKIDWICENSTLSNLHIEEVDWAEFLRHHQLREFISVGNL